MGFAIGCGNFHSHVYGLPPFRTETDHQNKMSPRTQGIVLMMQCYDATLFTQGKYIVRPPEPNMLVSPVTDNAKTHINMATASLQHRMTCCSKLCKRQWTILCYRLCCRESFKTECVHVTQNGWSKGVCSGFSSARGHLCMYNGLLMRQNRPAIPQSMHQDIMQHIHGGHLAMEKCKKRSSVLTRYK